jgi:Na+/melibiose symporter-like transporter
MKLDGSSNRRIDSMFQELLTKMDQKHWLRMVVCFLPGIITSKLAAMPGSPYAARVAGVCVLIAGVSLYMCWNKLRERLAETSLKGVQRKNKTR